MDSRASRAALAALVLLAGACGHRWADTPLTAAAARGDLAALNRLLAEGHHVDERDSSGVPPLSHAARAGRVAMLEALLAAGARPDAVDGAANGWTPLQHAIHKGQVGTVAALLAAGASPVASGRAGAPPIVMAAGYGQTEIVRLLLEHGADAHAESAGGVDALWAALGGGSLADITDGPPLGTCFPDTVAALLEAAPDLKLKPGAAMRVVSWLAQGECAGLLARYTPESQPR